MLLVPEYLLVYLTYLSHESLNEFETALVDISLVTTFVTDPTQALRDGALNTTVPFDSFSKAVAPGNQPPTCVPCLKTAMENYFQVVSSRADQYCERTRCPFIMEACRQRKQHADISDGFLLETAKVPQLSFAYCTGRDQCQVPDTPHEQYFARDSDEPETEFFAEEDDEFICASDGRGCFEKAMCRAVRRGVRRVRNFCDKTQCPYVKQVCRWGAENRPWAFGLIIGKIQPWKYAMGRCE